MPSEQQSSSSLPISPTPTTSDELSAIIGATISGAQYGVKIRLPHALVMTLLFRKGTPSEKLRIILQSTWEHSRNLASFAMLYKVFSLLTVASYWLCIHHLRRIIIYCMYCRTNHNHFCFVFS
jgi:hypothetical protein